MQIEMIAGISILTLLLAGTCLLWRFKDSLDAKNPGIPIFYWDENALPTAIDILDRINRVAGGRTLTAERARHLSSLGGRCILVYGQIGHLQAGPEWATRHAFFVIAPTESVPAFSHNSPDLDPLLKTPEFSIFTLSDKAARHLP